MDVLSDVISTVRTGQPRSARVAWHAPWGMRFTGRESPAAAFQVVLQGSCWLLVDGREPVQLGAGDVLFLPRGHEHALTSDPSVAPLDLNCVDFLRDRSELMLPDPGEPIPNLTCSNEFPQPFQRFGATSVGDTASGEPTCVTVGGFYHAGPTRPHPLLTELPSVVHLPARVGQRSELPLAVGLLGRELGSNRPGGDTLVPHLLDMLIVYILRTYLEETATGEGPGCGFAGALRDPAVHAAIQAVHLDPAHPWTVAELGERAGLSRAAFSRRFTALVGQSPLAYVTWWRLATAGRLLRESDAPINAIARRVGYSSQFAFANAFKREFGRSPGRYREAARLDPPEGAFDPAPTERSG
ncbi:AraC family transcriptional regulator [Nocardiopsis valliformis]|uniref:AraC family transcriptional regulator n=1 Tax=Nocardiopsis valliformis TaxID=239974 RepID=UPI00034D339C|nr:AraC family transcriptional regulator [Nocardiopsis valliformis]